MNERHGNMHQLERTGMLASKSRKHQNRGHTSLGCLAHLRRNRYLSACSGCVQSGHLYGHLFLLVLFAIRCETASATGFIEAAGNGSPPSSSGLRGSPAASPVQYNPLPADTLGISEKVTSSTPGPAPQGAPVACVAAPADWEPLDVKAPYAEQPGQKGSGYWSVKGSKILSSTGEEVIFSGVSWSGAESITAVVDGLWNDRPFTAQLDQMVQLGFNLVRIPFAGKNILPHVLPQSINYFANPTLVNKTALEVMDEIIYAAWERDLKVILDYHRLHGGQTPEWGLWWDDDCSEQVWLDNWVFMVKRYKNFKNVIGVDLFNEPHNSAVNAYPGPFWSADGEDEPYNWRAAAMRAANIIQDLHPDLLICVEGMWQDVSWANNLELVMKLPLELKVPNKLVYSIHEYGPEVYSWPWLSDSTFPANLPVHWDKYWGFVVKGDMAPVWIGEFGAKFNKSSPESVQVRERVWLSSLRQYMGAVNIPWTFWTWGPNSLDTGGILEADWATVSMEKVQILASIMHPGFGESPDLKALPSLST